MQTIVGVGSATIFTGLLLLLICFVCGVLVVHFSFMKKFSKMIEERLVKYIPGYDTYKSMAEEKLQDKVKMLPYTPALFKTADDLLQPAFIIEKDEAGHNTILIPDIPETHKGRILIVKEEKLQALSSISANEFDALLKNMGNGLLTQHSVLQ